MRSLIRRQMDRVGPTACWCLGFLTPLTAISAEQMVRVIDASELRFWVTLTAVQVLAFFGYLGSSLPDWARWRDETGTPVEVFERKLRILQGAVIAFLSGNAAYFAAYYQVGTAEVTAFISAAGAAYMGDKFLSPMMTRVGQVFGISAPDNTKP